MKPSKLAASACAVVFALPASVASGDLSSPTTKPEPAAAGRKVALALALAAKQPLRKYTPAEMKRMFPAFEHEPFDKAGFSHLSLPFHYEDRNGDGDPNEANAFAFLLSYALDWAPGCYCSRHAYFIFKRARRYMTRLAEKYDAREIEFAIEDWQATHAVGGKLVRRREGYSGILMIHDRTGRLARRVEYDRPRDFFDLLGDMSVDAMKLLGHEPSPALVKHLHTRQCKHRESVVDLGRAAWVEERSPEEFGIYDRILKRDPGFATVRHWRAAQKWWVEHNGEATMLEKARALDSYLVKMSLEGFSPSACSDTALAAKYPQWLREAEEMVGPDAPFLVEKKLKTARTKRTITRALLAEARKIGARYPNDYTFLYYLGRVHSDGGGLAADCDMGISIGLTALQNRYLTAEGHKRHAETNVARCARSLGYSDLCVQFLLPTALAELERGGPKEARADAAVLGDLFFNMGRFDEAWRWHRIAFKGYAEGTVEQNRRLVDGGIAAALAGRADILEQILRDRREKVRSVNMLAVLEGYRELLAGKVPDTQALEAMNLDEHWTWKNVVMLLTQCELLKDSAKHRHWLDHGLRLGMNQRPLAILLDQFNRRYPESETGAFYEAIEWLHPEDPWVVEAVSAWRQRGRQGWVPDPDKLLKDLKDYEPVRWPVADPARKRQAGGMWRRFRAGTFTCAVRRLIAARNYDKAEELAKRYLNFTVNVDSYLMRAHANHLIHRVEQARKAPKDTITPDDL